MDDSTQLVGFRRRSEIRVDAVEVAHACAEAVLRDQQGLGEFDFVCELRAAQPRRVDIGRGVTSGRCNRPEPLGAARLDDAELVIELFELTQFRRRHARGGPGMLRRLPCGTRKGSVISMPVDCARPAIWRGAWMLLQKLKHGEIHLEAFGFSPE